MKNIISIILTVFFTFAIITASSAEWQWPNLPKAYSFLQITGEVKAIDKNAATITVSKRIKDAIITAVTTVDDKTEIMMNDHKKNFDDIKIGDKVIVKYAKINGKSIAKRVVIEPPVPES